MIIADLQYQKQYKHPETGGVVFENIGLTTFRTSDFKTLKIGYKHGPDESELSYYLTAEQYAEICNKADELHVSEEIQSVADFKYDPYAPVKYYLRINRDNEDWRAETMTPALEAFIQFLVDMSKRFEKPDHEYHFHDDGIREDNWNPTATGFPGINQQMPFVNAHSSWNCSTCGRQGNTGNFCPDCGKPFKQ